MLSRFQRTLLTRQHLMYSSMHAWGDAIIIRPMPGARYLRRKRRDAVHRS